MIPQSCLGAVHLLRPRCSTRSGAVRAIASIQKDKKWSWSKLGYVDVSAQVLELVDRIERVFKADPEISAVTRRDDYPF